MGGSRGIRRLGGPPAGAFSVRMPDHPFPIGSPTVTVVRRRPIEGNRPLFRIPLPEPGCGSHRPGSIILYDERPAPACHAVTPPYFFFAGGGASGIGADAWSCTITQSLPRFSSTSVLRPSPFITSPVFGVISNEEVNVAQAMFPFL